MVKGCVRIAELRNITCNTGSYSVTCHLTQVNVPCLDPSQDGQYSIYLPLRDGKLSWPWWLVIYWDGLSIHRQSLLNSDPTRSWIDGLLILSPTS